MNKDGTLIPAFDEDRLFIEQIGQAVLRRPVDAGLLQNCLDRIANGASRGTITQMLLASEEALHQADTPLFVPPGHYYSPVCRPDALRPKNANAPPASLPGIFIDHDAMVRLWDQLVPAMRSHPFSARPKTGMRYAFENDAYSWGDGLILHAMIRYLAPKRIIEVGSGWSSACIIDTLETATLDGCALTLIDIDLTPAKSLTGHYGGRIDLLEQPVQHVDPAVFEQLESGDVLFIDSSHILKTDSDLNHLLFNVLPLLKPGVQVHFHDIFWPFDYPDGWTIGENRSWNEVYALRAYLTDSSKWRITWFNDYFAKRETDRARRDCPEFLINSGGAIWLCREQD